MGDNGSTRMPQWESEGGHGRGRGRNGNGYQGEEWEQEGYRIGGRAPPPGPFGVPPSRRGEQRNRFVGEPSIKQSHKSRWPSSRTLVEKSDRVAGVINAWAGVGRGTRRPQGRAGAGQSSGNQAAGPATGLEGPKGRRAGEPGVRSKGRCFPIRQFFMGFRVRMIKWA
eukprot:1790148-Pyramimonas_sp.AAC.1